MPWRCGSSIRSPAAEAARPGTAARGLAPELGVARQETRSPAPRSPRARANTWRKLTARRAGPPRRRRRAGGLRPREVARAPRASPASRASGCRAKVPVPRQGASSSTASSGRDRRVPRVGDDHVLPAAAGAPEVFARAAAARRRFALRRHEHPRGAAERDRLAARRGAGVVAPRAPGGSRRTAPPAPAPGPARRTPPRRSPGVAPAASASTTSPAPNGRRLGARCPRRRAARGSAVRSSRAGCSTSGGRLLFHSSSASVSSAPNRATQPATSHSGCECARGERGRPDPRTRRAGAAAASRPSRGARRSRSRPARCPPLRARGPPRC